MRSHAESRTPSKYQIRSIDDASREPGSGTQLAWVQVPRPEARRSTLTASSSRTDTLHARRKPSRRDARRPAGSSRRDRRRRAGSRHRRRGRSLSRGRSRLFGGGEPCQDRKAEHGEKDLLFHGPLVTAFRKTKQARMPGAERYATRKETIVRRSLAIVAALVCITLTAVKDQAPAQGAQPAVSFALAKSRFLSTETPSGTLTIANPTGATIYYPDWTVRFVLRNDDGSAGEVACNRS